MLYSMTGFGKADYEDDDIKLSVEIKSLNSKAIDIKLKFPNLPVDKNILLRKIISEQLIRGKIDCNFDLLLKNQPNKFTIKNEVFLDYYQQLKNLTEYAQPSQYTDFYSIIMNLPDVLEVEQADLDPVWDRIVNTLLTAINQLNNFRQQEGLATEKDILEKLKNIENLLKQIPKFEQIRNQQFRKKLQDSLAANNLTVDKDRFEQEIIFYLDKYDINEEQKRLSNHIKYFYETLKSENIEKGKKLTFIAQEMLREMNTLGTKSYCADIQKIIVLMKDNLEKIKEQLLNVL